MYKKKIVFMVSLTKALLYKQQFCQSACQRARLPESLTDVTTSHFPKFPWEQQASCFFFSCFPTCSPPPRSFSQRFPGAVAQRGTLGLCSMVANLSLQYRAVQCILKQYAAVHHSAVHCSAFQQYTRVQCVFKKQATVQCRVSSMGILPDATDKATLCCAAL